MKHYQEIVDDLFGNLYKHRTLRTLFDYNSAEWEKTTINEKLDILKKILDSDKITFQQLISGYRHYFTKEVENKTHIIDSLESSLLILLQNSL